MDAALLESQNWAQSPRVSSFTATGPSHATGREHPRSAAASAGLRGRGRRQPLGQGKAARPPGLPGAVRGAQVRAVTAHSDFPPLAEERPRRRRRRRRPRPPRSAPPRREMAAPPPPRGALPRTAAWRPPACLLPCLPVCRGSQADGGGSSSGCRPALIAAAARRGAAQRRPPAPLGRPRGLCPTRSRAWDPPEGGAWGGRSLPLFGIRNRAKRAAGRLLRPPSRCTGRRLVPAIELAAPEGLCGHCRAVK